MMTSAQIKVMKEFLKADSEKLLEDKLFDIMYSTQISEQHGGDYEKYFAPLREKLRKLLSDDVCKELDEILTDCAVACDRHYGIEGMRVALHHIALDDPILA